GQAPKRWGNAHPNIVPYQTFQASNGWIIVAVGNDGQFRRFVDTGGMPELADDPRFATNPQRVANRDVLVPILAEMVKRFSKGEWIDKLEAAGVPCGPINSLDEVFENEQVQARGLRVDLPHPSAGTVKLVGSPVKMSATPPKAASHPPLLGEHTDAVLRGVLDFSPEQIEALRVQGVI
ncbi:CoA transferase, partial [Ralstonia sp.]|uniref:CaiB/BaiF CoA transferase family protein n=1 Tax=Ralstonia sp. TaxID=54061 RepID=UPI0031D184D1